MLQLVCFIFMFTVYAVFTLIGFTLSALEMCAEKVVEIAK